MTTPAPESSLPVARRHATAALQTIVIILFWLVPVLLHRDNDGLWFRGDAARHALNGAFWADFIAAHPSQPREYALSYYARFPALTPPTYPPLFHLLESVAFAWLGPSPYVAKGLVLGFALLASLCLAAWLRRFVDVDAGWAGAWLALQPGLIIWGNAVMLNVPSMALVLFALYWARRCIDEPERRALLFALTFAIAAVLTYFPSALMLPVLGIWLARFGPWYALWDRHRRVLLASAAVLAMILVLIFVFVPMPLSHALVSPRELAQWDQWRFYLRALRPLLSPLILVLAGIGLVSTWSDHRYRREVRLLCLWLIIIYCGLSCLRPREARYGLLLVPAFVLLAAIGATAIARFAHACWGGRAAGWYTAVLVGVGVFLAARAPAVPVQKIDGFADVARFVVTQAPSDRVLYDGRSDGTFIFYMRANDPDFTRAVVRGSKLLYASALTATWRLTERVSTTDDVMRALAHDCGCRWVLVERQDSDAGVAAVHLLHRAVEGPQFRFVRSFPIAAPQYTRVDVYEYLGALDTPAEVELPAPILGEGTVYRARPIER